MTQTDIADLGGLVVDIDADDLPDFVAPTVTVKLGGDIYTAHFPDDAFVVKMIESAENMDKASDVMQHMWSMYEACLDADEYKRLKAAFGKKFTLRTFMNAAQRLTSMWEPYIESYFAELVDVKPPKEDGNRATRRATRKK